MFYLNKVIFSQMIFKMCFNLKLLFTHNFSRFKVISCIKQYLLYLITVTTCVCYIWFGHMNVRKLTVIRYCKSQDDLVLIMTGRKVGWC